MQRRPSAFVIKLEAQCVGALDKWADLTDPADVDDAVNEFVPREQPQRDETLQMLCQLMKLTVDAGADDEELMATVVHGATRRLIEAENMAGRRSQSSRVTMDETHDLVTIVLVGDAGVGKTCFMIRFVRDQFVSSTRSTVGMDFCTRQLAVDTMQGSESSVVQQLTVQVWDTAGQEQFRSLAATYYRKAGGVMILYDANVRATFDHIPGWIEEVRDNSETAALMIIGAKAEGSETEVSPEEGEALAAEHNAIFASVSSKEGVGVVAAFKSFSERVLAMQEMRDERLSTVKQSISLGPPDSQRGRGLVAEKKGGGCACG